MTETPGAQWLADLAAAAHRAADSFATGGVALADLGETVLVHGSNMSRRRFRRCPTWHQYVAPLPDLAGDV